MKEKNQMVDQEKVINKLTHLQDEKKKLERILGEQEKEKGKKYKSDSNAKEKCGR